MSLDLITIRNPGGITNVTDVSPFQAITKPVEPLYHTFFEDFDVFAAGDWTITETDSNATEALTAGDGGLLLITNTAGLNDLVSMQLVAAGFVLELGKKLFFEAKFKTSDATNARLVAGLQPTGTTPFTTSDGAYFIKASGATALNFEYKNGSEVSVTTGLATMANATNIVASFYYDGLSTITYSINGVQQGNVTITTLYTTAMAPTIAIGTAATAAKTLTVDYVYVAKQRTVPSTIA